VSESRAILILCAALAAVPVCGQPVAVKARSAIAPSNSAPAQVNAAMPVQELVLTGIIDISSYRRACLQIESPGRAPQFRTMAAGEQSGDITLLAIDSEKARVTVCHRGLVQELSLNRQVGPPRPSPGELQRDASHSAYHTKRAQLDRDRDDELSGK